MKLTNAFIGGWQSLKKGKYVIHRLVLALNASSAFTLRAMAPQEKTTKEQRKYLWSLMDDYLEVQKQGNFTKFWARLFLAWFKLWPVEEDARIQDEEQRRVAYALAIKEQEGVSVEVQIQAGDPDMPYSVSQNVVPGSGRLEKPNTTWSTNARCAKAPKSNTVPSRGGDLLEEVLCHTGGLHR